MLRVLLLDLFELTTSIIMAIPCHWVRLLYICILSHIGKGCCFMRHIRFHTPWRITIGDDVVINRNVMLDGRCGLKIGNHVDIGEYVSIWSLQHNPFSPDHVVEGDLTEIGDNVWIAPRCIILPGVKIGKGAVVGTGSIVTKDIPPHSLAVGIPAKVIKELPNREFVNNYCVFF